MDFDRFSNKGVVYSVYLPFARFWLKQGVIPLFWVPLFGEPTVVYDEHPDCRNKWLIDVLSFDTAQLGVHFLIGGKGCTLEISRIIGVKWKWNNDFIIDRVTLCPFQMINQTSILTGWTFEIGLKMSFRLCYLLADCVFPYFQEKSILENTCTGVLKIFQGDPPSKVIERF